MNCERVRGLLPQYLDQDLEGRELAMVREHLEGCPACRERLDLNRRLVVELAEQPPFAEEAEAGARVRRRVMEAVAQYQSWGPLWRAVGTAGNAVGWVTVSVLLVALVFGLAISGRPLLEGRLSPATVPPTPLASETPPEPSPTATATNEPPLTPTAEASPSQPPTLPPTSPTPGPTADVLPIMQGYGHDGLGIAVEYPLSWTAAIGSNIAADGEREDWVAFTSDYYAGGSQAIGRYSIRVAVRRTTAETAAGAVEAWLRPMVPEVRDQIKQRELTVGGEDAIEVGPLPGERFGAHMVVTIHEGREYRLTFSPDQPFDTPHDAEARAVFAAFLRTFAFMPVARSTPTPTVGPVPTETPGPAAVSSLIVTPHDPSVLYAVTGGRLYRSLDRGASWTAGSEAGLPAGAGLSVVAVDYGHPDSMYVLTEQGIYRRQGTGEWGFVSALQATALAVDLQDPTVLWAGVRRSPERDAVILRSADGGRTWTRADLGIPTASEDEWVANIAPNPNDPSLLWAVVRSGGQGALYRGDRSGQWQPLSPAGPEGDGGYSFTGVAYDPNAGLLFAGCDADASGTMRLLRAANAGAADPSTILWQEAAVWTGAPGVGWVRPLAVDAREPKSLYLSLGAGPLEVPGLAGSTLLVSHNGGLTWEPFGAGLAPVGPSE